jgi:hypothetical protein
MMALLWLLLMLIWLGGLLFGLWWIWPHVERGALTTDLIAALVWLSAGAVAWVAALSLGRQRYWRR